MFRYRFRIVLLTLGVVLGYGSAYSHLVHGRPLFGHHPCEPLHSTWP
jgi:hypothetical protein